MSVIINIETSSRFCSVAVTVDGAVDMVLTDDQDMNHARFLAPAVDKCLSHLSSTGRCPDAVAVSLGPGSYTGLRIGLSFAKGFCFGRNLPLIGINTLKLLAVKAQFKRFDWEGDELFIPMIDARRKEVYTAVYDPALREVREMSPVILQSDTFADLPDRRTIFIGDGTPKAREILSPKENYEWLGIDMPNAADMLALAEKAMREEDFMDLAYGIPVYLKEYEAVVGCNKVLQTVK